MDDLHLQINSSNVIEQLFILLHCLFLCTGKLLPLVMQNTEFLKKICLIYCVLCIKLDLAG